MVHGFRGCCIERDGSWFPWFISERYGSLFPGNNEVALLSQKIFAHDAFLDLLIPGI